MKTAMIWGASGGIGGAILGLLQQEGWRTAAVCRDAGRLNVAADFTAEADVSNAWQVQQAVLGIAMDVEAVELWVYAVGDIASTPVAQQEPEAWARILEANLSGAHAAAHHSLPLLAEEAHMVFLGGISERLRLPGLAAYAAAKAGLEAFAEAFAKEQRKKRITVVRPAAVATPFWDKVPLKLPASAAAPEKVAARILEAHQSGHKGTLDLA